MNKHDQKRVTKNKQAWKNLKQHQVISRKEMKMPDKNIAIVIRPGLTVYISDPSKVEEAKLKFAGR